MHCKSQGSVVPSFHLRPGKTAFFPERLTRCEPAACTRLANHNLFGCGLGFDAGYRSKVTVRREYRWSASQLLLPRWLRKADPTCIPTHSQESEWMGHGADADSHVRRPGSKFGRGCSLDAGVAGNVNPQPGGKTAYHTRQEFAGYMGWPLVQPKALPNSSKFCTEPLTRQRPGEWGSTSADWREDCSVWFWHHTSAKPRK